MNRREFMTALGGAASWPVSARAEPTSAPVVGVLAAAPINIDEKRMLSFHRGLGEAGYRDGQNVTVAYVRADGHYDRFDAVATSLVQRQVSVIVVPNSTTAALAAKAATAAIPIVFSATADPVQVGLVAGLARPGGNVTGIYSFSTDLGAKRLGLLRELVPTAGSVAVLANPANPVTALGLQNAEAAARAIGLEVRILKASNVGEIDAAFATLADGRPDVFMVINDPVFTSRRTQIVLSAARHGLPAVYSNREYAEAGGLMCYSTSVTEIYRQLGTYVGRILSGASPADLPVVQSTTFELIINLQAAKAIGLQFPPTLLARADEVIE